MSAVSTLARAPAAAVEFANVLLTQDDAAIGTTPKDAVWTWRTTTLYRYRSTQRRHPVPVLLVFALINRPDIFDLRPGNSFVQFLLGEGFDVFLLDWGVPDDADADLGIEAYVCDALPWGIRETLRAAGQEQVSVVGWCIGGALTAMHAALEPDGPARNLVLLTTPVDTANSRYGRWVARESFDPERVTDAWPSVPGGAVDTANKLLKPVTNLWTTNRRLWQQVLEGKHDRESFQAMSKWVGDNPPFPGRAYREWITWMYKENRLVRGTLRLRGRRVDLGRIHQDLLVVTAGADHITPTADTEPIFTLVGSQDVTRLARPGGHIGLMTGSRAREDVWVDIAAWLAARSDA
jgi:polyhydroxyalkanoate synthase